MTDNSLPFDIQQRLDEHLDAVDAVLRKYDRPRTERSAIVDELANQIIDMLTARTRDSGGGAGRELSIDDLEAVLSEMDPPEAYARQSIDLPAEPTLPAFATESHMPEPRFNRATIVGLCWIVWMLFALSLLVALLVIEVRPALSESQGAAMNPTGIPQEDLAQVIQYPCVMAYQTWWGITLLIFIVLPGLLAPIGTTILGWVGISQIKNSNGRQHGLGLAVFNAVVFLLTAIASATFAVMLLPCALWYTDRPTIKHSYPIGSTPPPDSPSNMMSFIGVIIIVAIFVTLLVILFLVCRRIIRAVWRQANQPAMPA